MKIFVIVNPQVKRYQSYPYLAQHKESGVTVLFTKPTIYITLEDCETHYCAEENLVYSPFDGEVILRNN